MEGTMELSASESRSERQQRAPKLSICISTLNRAGFIGTALDKILPQLTDECEVLVVDNASTDNTAEVVGERIKVSDRLRYIRKETNEGVDGNYDRAVELARGDYCWLMADDDFVMPEAVATILAALRQEPSLVLVNYEFRDFSMATVLQPRVLDFETDRIYEGWEVDRLFADVGDCIRYIGTVVIRRSIWLSRQRDRYKGTLYAFVGMIFQDRFPRRVHVIARPCVSYRSSNHAPTPSRMMEIAFGKWPSLIESLPLSDSCKGEVASVAPWKHLPELLFWRGSGVYSYDQYRQWVRPRLKLAREKIVPLLSALLPPVVANSLLVLHFATRREKLRQLEGFKLEILRGSPFYFRNFRPWKRGVITRM